MKRELIVTPGHEPRDLCSCADDSDPLGNRFDDLADVLAAPDRYAIGLLRADTIEELVNLFLPGEDLFGLGFRASRQSLDLDLGERRECLIGMRRCGGCRLDRDKWRGAILWDATVEVDTICRRSARRRGVP